MDWAFWAWFWWLVSGVLCFGLLSVTSGRVGWGKPAPILPGTWYRLRDGQEARIVSVYSYGVFYTVGLDSFSADHDDFRAGATPITPESQRLAEAAP